MADVQASAFALRREFEVPEELLHAIDARLTDAATAVQAVADAHEEVLRRQAETRKSRGAYYTPGYLVDFVLSRTLGPELALRDFDGVLRMRIVDPACGPGLFVVPAIQAVVSHCLTHHRPAVADRFGAGPAGVVELSCHVAQNCVKGRDIDPLAATLCRLAVRLATGAERTDIQCVDSLLSEPPSADVIVGNPPWGQKGIRPAAEYRAQLRDRFVCGGGTFDPFKVFVELAHHAIEGGGRWGLVLPDIVLHKNYETLRRLILAESSLEWVVHSGRAFRDVNLDTAVLVASRGRADAGPVRVWRELPKSWRNMPPETRTRDVAVFASLPRSVFNVFAEGASLALLHRLSSNRSLGQVFEMHEGVHSGNCRHKLFVDKPTESADKLLVRGNEVTAFDIDWAGKWLNTGAVIDRALGEYANLGQPHWYREAKVLVRRTGDRVIAAMDTEGRYASNNLFVVLSRRKCINELRAATALLNSDYATWYFRTVQPRAGRVFAELKIQHLLPLPLPGDWERASRLLGDLQWPPPARELNAHVAELMGFCAAEQAEVARVASR